MIGKPFSEIVWSDLQQLIAAGREEDDRIEFKNSFKGQDDYAALNDKQRQVALDSIARESLAFLNTRGGDIIIGIDECEGPTPAAAALRPVKSPGDAAERIARGLAALIEPAQTNITVRGLTDPLDPTRGVVLVRVEASVRAPHRSKRTLECFARRGSESVPMAMDEIQDLTVNRTRIRLEQMELIDHQFADFKAGRSEHRDLGNEVFHVRVVVVPLLEQFFEIDETFLGAFANKDLAYYSGNGNRIINDVAFRGLYSRWVPVLRGRKQESFQEYGGHPANKDFQYVRKIVKESGTCLFDYAVDSHFDGEDASLHAEWVTGFFAQIAQNLTSLAKVRPSAFPCTVRVGIRSKGNMHLGYGDGMWAEKKPIPQDTFFPPDFLLRSEADLDAFFQQMQIDLFSLINVAEDEPYSLTNPIEQGSVAVTA